MKKDTFKLYKKIHNSGIFKKLYQRHHNLEDVPDTTPKAEIDQAAGDYSFNIESLIFPELPEELRERWVLETENTFKAGMGWLLKRLQKTVTSMVTNAYEIPKNNRNRNYYLAQDDAYCKILDMLDDYEEELNKTDNEDRKD